MKIFAKYITHFHALVNSKLTKFEFFLQSSQVEIQDDVL